MKQLFALTLTLTLGAAAQAQAITVTDGWQHFKTDTGAFAGGRTRAELGRIGLDTPLIGLGLKNEVDARLRMDTHGILGLTYTPAIRWDQRHDFDVQIGGAVQRANWSFDVKPLVTPYLSTPLLPGLELPFPVLFTDRSGDGGHEGFGSSTTNVDFLGFGRPDLPLMLPSAGIGVNLVTRFAESPRYMATLETQGFTGRMMATSALTGETQVRWFGLTESTEVDFNLDAPGRWDFSFDQVSLNQRFTLNSGLNVWADFSVGVGLFCNDPFSASDNVFCVESVTRLDQTLPLQRIADVTHHLPMNTRAMNFSVEVLATPVPEPSSWAFMGAGLAALAGLARRRLPRRAAVA